MFCPACKNQKYLVHFIKESFSIHTYHNPVRQVQMMTTDQIPDASQCGDSEESLRLEEGLAGDQKGNTRFIEYGRKSLILVLIGAAIVILLPILYFVIFFLYFLFCFIVFGDN
jgi:hypothetical protein